MPVSTLSLLGSGRVLLALAHKLESVQDIRFEASGQVLRVKLLQISGRKGRRSIRLYKKGLAALDLLRPGLYNWYMDRFRNHNFTNDLSHTERNHRVAEAIAACFVAGVETDPYTLPLLQKEAIRRTVPDTPCFYVARDFKNTADETNKTMYARIVGSLFYPGGCFAVYNTRNAVMKWNGLGEVKASANLQELARMNAGIDEVSSALLFGNNAEVALKTILESDKSRRLELRFDRIYRQVHFIPLDRDGIRLIRLLILPDWNERLLTALFNNSQRSFNLGTMEYDAIIGDKMILSHLDGDITRLIRFREALSQGTYKADVVCYPWQAGFVRSYLSGLAGIRELGMDAVEDTLYVH